MRFLNKLVKSLVLTTGIALVAISSAHANYINYASQASFLQSVNQAETDNFATWNGGNFEILNNAQAKAASIGNIGYVSTGFQNWNIITGGSLCWGCNGSGYIDLTGTNFGTVNGVYGFSVNLSINSGYNEYITFGDNSVLAITNPTGFYGITSDSLIKKVEFAHAPGQASFDGSVQIKNVTIAAGAVPEPATMALFGLGLLAFGVMRRTKK